jgi:hypothetical protein
LALGKAEKIAKKRGGDAPMRAQKRVGNDAIGEKSINFLLLQLESHH